MQRLLAFNDKQKRAILAGANDAPVAAG